jgi:hypothetical protein
MLGDFPSFHKRRPYGYCVRDNRYRLSYDCRLGFTQACALERFIDNIGYVFTIFYGSPDRDGNSGGDGPAYVLAGEVGMVERVAEGVGIGVGAASADGIDGQEAGLGRVEGAGAELDDPGRGVGELAADGVGAEAVGAGGVGRAV